MMLEGKGILITGGSRGIGAAAVRALAAAGASVYFTYSRNRESAQVIANELGSRVIAAHCDLADADALPALVEDAVARLGAIDALVNNAGIFAENPFFDNTYDAWRRGWQQTFAVNVFGAANLTYLVLRHMRERKSGIVVNVASRAAHRGELTFADYGASKAALVNLTKSIARSCAADGITSVAIAPGFIETDMAAEELQRRRAEIEGEIPSRRVGSPEEIASIIAFLCSDASRYLNGATLDANGGSYVR